MPGIYGNISLKEESIKYKFAGRELVNNEHQFLNEASILKGEKVIANFGGVALKQGNKPTTVFEDEEIVVIFYGEIYEVLSDEKDIRVWVRDASDAAKLVKQYGEKRIADFNGNYLLAWYEKNNGKFVLCNDRFGIYPLYWTKMKDEFIFSSSVRLLANQIELELDFVGLAEQLSFDYCLEDRTLFKNIKYILPASKFVVENGEFNQTIYWTERGREDRRYRNKNECLKELKKRMLHAIDLRKADKNIIGLTGGFDSRIVLAMLDELGAKNIQTFTFGNKGSGDVVAAEQLAKGYCTNHHSITFTKDAFEESALPIIKSSEAQCSSDRFYIYQTAQKKRECGEFEISATGGDVVSGQKSNFTGMFPVMSRKLGKLNKEKLKRKIFYNIMSGRIAVPVSNMYSKDFCTLTFKEMYEDFSRAFDASEGDTLGSTVMWLKLRTLERRSTIPHINLCNEFEIVRYNIYDYRLMEFFAMMPQKYRYGQRLYIRLIQDFYPRAAMIPHSETGKKIRESSVLNIDFITAMNFLRNKLGIRKKAWHSTFDFVKKQVIASDINWMADRINSIPENLGSFCFREPLEGRKLISEVQQGTVSYKHLIDMINLGILFEVFRIYVE